jgi:hypothetical protein
MEKGTNHEQGNGDNCVRGDGAALADRDRSDGFGNGAGGRELRGVTSFGLWVFELFGNVFLAPFGIIAAVEQVSQVVDCYAKLVCRFTVSGFGFGCIGIKPA